MDYQNAVDIVADAIAKGTTPLTAVQRLYLLGALSVLLDNAYKDGIIRGQLSC